MKKTDKELQLELAKMLPEKLILVISEFKEDIGQLSPRWKTGHRVTETEWLHVCWLIEQKLSNNALWVYHSKLKEDVSASWQQRAEALIQIHNN